MRKVTQQAVAAFLSSRKFSSGNTQVTTDDDLAAAVLKLHGNTIARLHTMESKLNSGYGGHPGFFITNAGWFSNTTKERLNGLPGVHIHQRNYEWYLNGERWDGGVTFIPWVQD